MADGKEVRSEAEHYLGNELIAAIGCGGFETMVVHVLLVIYAEIHVD